MNYKIADVVFDIEYRCKYLDTFMKDYKTDETAVEKISVPVNEVEEAYKKEPEFPKGYHESLCIFRHISKILLEKYDGMLFHGSSIECDNKGIIFTAKSGTGKSTHTSLWLKVFNDKVKVINDDKPILRYIDGTFYIYGTPWMGKHNLGSNVKVPLIAVGKIERAKNNSVEPLSETEIIQTVLEQTQKFYNADTMSNLLNLTNKLIEQVKFYKVRCNMQDDAATVSKKGIIGE